MDQGSSPIQGYIAYGLYKNAKREWITQFMAANNGRRPTPAQLNAFVGSFTAQTIQTFETQAAAALVEFADGAVAEQRPAIVEEALRGTFWSSIGMSLLGSLIYTVLLIAIVIALAVSGVDLLDIVDKLQGPTA